MPSPSTLTFFQPIASRSKRGAGKNAALVGRGRAAAELPAGALYTTDLFTPMDTIKVAQSETEASHAIEHDTWVEGTHVGLVTSVTGAFHDDVLRAATHSDPPAGPAWFYPAPGSGVSLFTGNTLVLSEPKLTAAGISIVDASEMLISFWSPTDTKLTRYLGLNHSARLTYDTVQRLAHHETTLAVPLREIALNPRYLAEDESVYGARGVCAKRAVTAGG